MNAEYVSLRFFAIHDSKVLLCSGAVGRKEVHLSHGGTEDCPYEELRSKPKAYILRCTERRFFLVLR